MPSALMRSSATFSVLHRLSSRSRMCYSVRFSSERVGRFACCTVSAPRRQAPNARRRVSAAPLPHFTRRLRYSSSACACGVAVAKGDERNNWYARESLLGLIYDAQMNRGNLRTRPDA